MQASRIGVALLSFGLFAARPALAQQALYVLNGKSPVLVRDVRVNTPIAEVDGQMVPMSSAQYSLGPGPEFAPVFITVRDLRTWNTHVDMSNAQQVTMNFHLNAEFESACHLEHVFLALDMQLADNTRTIYLQELGEMVPRQPKSLSLSVPLGRAYGETRYVIHLFTSGQEVLHSEMPVDFREKALNRMVADGIKGAQNAPPRPFVGPLPEYPKSLVKSGVVGNAVIHMRIAANGSAQDLQITSASDPAFGDAALEAFRQWRFYPRVKDGAPVETSVEMPITFPPPRPGAN